MWKGSFSWRELATAEPEAALAFYRQAMGWSARPAPHPGYTIMQVDGWGVGGITDLAQGVQAGWTGYVEVPDVDASVARAVALGGHMVSEPSEIPGVIRRATIADPEGTLMILSRILRPALPGGPREPAPETPGMFSWAELIAGNWTHVFDFYAGLFGWTRSFAFTLGPIGTYQVFAYQGRDIGGMMNGNLKFPSTYWGFYAQVGGTAAAAARWRNGGGAVAMGPHQAPGDRWAAQVRDPQGHLLGLLSNQA